MQNMVCGNQNTALGNQAMYGPTGGTACGNSNTALGSTSLHALVNGTGNVCTGSASCTAITYGDSNTCNGNAACYNYPINGSQNVGVGQFSGPSSDVSLSTSVGYQANVGSQAVAVGAYATAVVNSVALGETASCSSYNSVALGQSSSDGGFHNCVALGSGVSCNGQHVDGGRAVRHQRELLEEGAHAVRQAAVLGDAR